MRLLALLTCLSTLLAGADDLAQARAPSAKIPWSRCGAQLQCGKVRVPLDWSRPHGRSLTLPVIRHLASGPSPKLGSLFVNGGGGMGSTKLVRLDGASLDALGQGRFDVVGWALRGGGGNPLVRCFADARSRARFWDHLGLPVTRAQELRYVPKVRAYAQRCAALSRSLLSHVSTADDARDLDYLRRLVGDRRLTYRAVSYGTFLGQTYANMFPSHVRAMALDGLIDPAIAVSGNEPRFANTVQGIDAGLGHFESLCESAGSANCALAGHGPVVTRVDQLLATLRRHSLPAPTARPPGALTYGDAVLALFTGMANPGAWPPLARALNKAASGDGSALATSARTTLVGVHSAPSDPPEAIVCADSPTQQGLRAWPSVVARFTRLSRIGGPFVSWTGWAPCASWPPSSAHRYTGPWNVTTRHPILIVGTTQDPLTPYANSVGVSRLLGNAVLLTHDGYGHTSEPDPSACVRRVTRHYLVALQVPPPLTVCPSDRQPFDPRFGEPRR